MSEPVGNEPRRTRDSVSEIKAISGNSHREREAASAETTPAREPAQKIVEGKVTIRKKAWYKRIGQNFLADDVGNVGEYVMMDVLVPAAKAAIVNGITAAIEGMLFGRSQRGSTRRAVGRSLIDEFRDTRYDRVRGESRFRDERDSSRYMSREARARHDFGSVVLETRGEALEVIGDMVERIKRYGNCTVRDLYDILGVTGTHADNNWGWTELMTVDVKQVVGGFMLDLPEPEPMR